MKTTRTSTVTVPAHQAALRVGWKRSNVRYSFAEQLAAGTRETQYGDVYRRSYLWGWGVCHDFCTGRTGFEHHFDLKGTFVKQAFHILNVYSNVPFCVEQLLPLGTPRPSKTNRQTPRI